MEKSPEKCSVGMLVLEEIIDPNSIDSQPHLGQHNMK